MRCFTQKLDLVSNIMWAIVDAWYIWWPSLYTRYVLFAALQYSFFSDGSLWGAVLAAGLTDELKADTSDLVEFFLSARETHFEIKLREIWCV